MRAKSKMDMFLELRNPKSGGEKNTRTDYKRKLSQSECLPAGRSSLASWVRHKIKEVTREKYKKYIGALSIF
jgi:hypothetical protein